MVLAVSKDPWEGEQLGKKGPWSPCDPTKETNDGPVCWSDFGSIVDTLCSPRKGQSRDRKCYVRRSNPYLGRTSFRSTSACWWWPPGLWQTAFLNATESERITPRSSGFNAVQKFLLDYITLLWYFATCTVYTHADMHTHEHKSRGKALC